MYRRKTAKPPKPARASWNRLEFIQRYGISPGTFHNLVKRGELVARKIGTKTIVTVADEQRWLNNLPHPYEDS